MERAEGARRTRRRWRSARSAILARPFTIEGRTLSVTASIGIGVYPGDGRDFGELLKNADAATNHAKETGRNSFRFFSPELNARAVARLGMENDLRHALARGELLLHWQPVVATGPARGGAARWSAPRRWCAGSIRATGC